MRIPKTLSICGHTISVKFRKRLFLNGVDCYGIYDYEKHIIYLKMGMDKTRRMEVCLHECIHAIDDIHGLKLSEKQVNLLGIELLALIRNNKLNFLSHNKVGI